MGASLNGLGNVAVEGAKIVEGLTSCPGLHRLTLTPLRDLISPRSSIRSRAAWCPRCLSEWRKANEVVYSPLIWHLSPVQACPFHNDIRLVDVCPHCKRQFFPLAPSALPGRCPRCAQLL